MINASRRDFLKALAATAISLGINPYLGVTADDELYQNHRLRLSFSKPSGWEFDSIADFAAVRERQVVWFDDDEDEIHPLKDPQNLPVVLITNPRFRQGDFAPAIGLYDEPLSDEPSDEISAHCDMIEGFAYYYKDVEVIEEPQLLNVNGAIGTQSSWSYLHESEDGQYWLLKVRTLLFFHPPRVQTFYLVDDCKRLFVPPETFDRFIHSIKYQ